MNLLGSGVTRAASRALGRSRPVLKVTTARPRRRVPGLGTSTAPEEYLYRYDSSRASFSSLALSAPLLGSTAAPAAPAAKLHGNNFYANCGFSHTANDDPIVYPRQPGRSHPHTFFGNKTADAGSTPTSLGAGGTTCKPPADKAAYWVPTLLKYGQEIRPPKGQFYYNLRGYDQMHPFPAGLKMVAGNAHAHHPQSTRVVYWTCGGSAGVKAFAPSSTAPATCPVVPKQFKVDIPVRLVTRVGGVPELVAIDGADERLLVPIRRIPVQTVAIAECNVHSHLVTIRVSRGHAELLTRNPLPHPIVHRRRGPGVHERSANGGSHLIKYVAEAKGHHDLRCSEENPTGGAAVDR